MYLVALHMNALGSHSLCVGEREHATPQPCSVTRAHG